MSQFNCPFCDEGFEQRSRYERHLQTSHPKQAPDAADLAQALKGVDFPKQKAELHEIVKSKNKPKALELLKELSEQEFRDAAQVMRALGAAKTHEEKPNDLPSKRGGEQALKSKSPSAAGLAKAFKGIHFPKTAREIKTYMHEHDVDQEIVSVVDQFHEGTYRNMADIEMEFRVVQANQ